MACKSGAPRQTRPTGRPKGRVSSASRPTAGGIIRWPRSTISDRGLRSSGSRLTHSVRPLTLWRCVDDPSSSPSSPSPSSPQASFWHRDRRARPAFSRVPARRLSRAGFRPRRQATRSTASCRTGRWTTASPSTSPGRSSRRSPCSPSPMVAVAISLWMPRAIAGSAARSVVRFEPFNSAFRALRETDSQTFSLA